MFGTDKNFHLRVNQTFRSIFLNSIICLLLLGVAHGTIWAQSTFGSVRGVAQDESGGVLPGAKVTLHNVGENTDRVGTTGPDGGFVLENVKAGQYTLHATVDGFAETVMSGVSVEARQDLRLTVTMRVAAQ